MQMPPLDRTGLSEARAQHAAGPLLLERFDYLPAHRSPALLSLSVRLPVELPGEARPILIVEREAVEQLFSPRLASTSSFPSGDPGDWLWRGVFAVPSQLLSQPQTSFAVRFLDDVLLPLPAPADRRMGDRRTVGNTRGRTWRYVVRRGALLLVVTCQLSLLPGFATSGALADGPTETPATVEPVTEPSTESAEETTGAPEGGSEEAPTPPAGAPEAPQEAAPEAPGESPPTTPAPKTPVGASSGSDPTNSSPQAPVGATASQPSDLAIGEAFTQSSAPRHVHVSAGTERKPQARPHDANGAAHARTVLAREKSRHSTTKTASAVPDVATPPAEGTSSSVPVFEGLPVGLANIEPNEPPAYLIPIYKQASRRYHVPWRVLAAINEIESDYGQNLSVSSAGAVGWMQFMPATWQEWGVDADHDGYANPYSPQDAIFAAARYLQASGAEHDLSGAIFAYNHADWYVTEVLLRARMLRDSTTFARIEKGYSLPLDARYMQELGRTDDGVDIETAPDGALVYSITPGVVSAVASDPAGFGPNYPVVEATSGSLAGQHIYYGHVAQALVQPGQRVVAGQPIAIIGHTGDAADLGHGHIEIGFSDAGGAPLNQHGAEAWTPAGSVMRAFLVELSASFGIHSS